MEILRFLSWKKKMTRTLSEFLDNFETFSFRLSYLKFHEATFFPQLMGMGDETTPEKMFIPQILGADEKRQKYLNLHGEIIFHEI